MFIAALFSALGLLIHKREDLNLMKVIIYPRALEALYNLLVEKNVVKPVKHGETVLYYFTLFFFTYNYIFEPHNMGASTVKSLDYYADLSNEERMMFDVMRLKVRENILKSNPKAQFNLE